MKIENSTAENMVVVIRKILTTMPNTRIFATKRAIGRKYANFLYVYLSTTCDV